MSRALYVSRHRTFAQLPQEQNKSSLYSIHFRVTIDWKKRYYTIKLQMKVNPQQWTGKSENWVFISHPFAFEINNRIIEKRTIITDLIKKYYNLGKPLNFYVLKREL